jgi:hypothetical protein
MLTNNDLHELLSYYLKNSRIFYTHTFEVNRTTLKVFKYI